jgi:hypothetical protein
VQVAPPSELDEVFIFSGGFTDPLPDDIADFEVKDTELIVIIFIGRVERGVIEVLFDRFII